MVVPVFRSVNPPGGNTAALVICGNCLNYKAMTAKSGECTEGCGQVDIDDESRCGLYLSHIQPAKAAAHS